MAFDLQAIQAEFQAAPPASPYPVELAVAVVNDCFRVAGLVPPDRAAWKKGFGPRGPLRDEQLGMLAHFLAYTSLRRATAARLAAGFEIGKALAAFFAMIEPLTAEMIRANTFRQEEFLRKWVHCVRGTVTGEVGADSARKLEQLDYRKTLAEFDRAEKARKAEAERRAKLLKEAAERDAAARGWRE